MLEICDETRQFIKSLGNLMIDFSVCPITDYSHIVQCKKYLNLAMRLQNAKLDIPAAVT